jgi:hypothetical protein
VLCTLASLAALKERDRLEVVVVNYSGRDIRPGIDERFPNQPVFDVPAESKLAHAQHAGVERTTGSIVAILNERYTVNDQWLSALEESHRDGAGVVAGVVAPSPSLTSAEWAMYLSEYAHVAPPLSEGTLDWLQAVGRPYGNISYERRVLDQFPRLSTMGHFDLRRSLFDCTRFVGRNDMRAEFTCPYSMREYLVERRQVSRDFAVARAQGMNRGARVTAALSRIALPPVLAARTMKRVFRSARLSGKFVLAFPWIIGFGFVQTIAEMKGFISNEPLAKQS